MRHEVHRPFLPQPVQIMLVGRANKLCTVWQSRNYRLFLTAEKQPNIKSVLVNSHKIGGKIFSISFSDKKTIKIYLDIPKKS